MEKIFVVRSVLSRDELKKYTLGSDGDMVKAVVDISRGIMAIGGELHADEEALLLSEGSKQEYLWGINLYPEKFGEDFIEFDSMINIRPSQGNRSRHVDNKDVREKILKVVHGFILPTNEHSES